MIFSEKRKNVWMILLVTITNNHISFIPFKKLLVVIYQLHILIKMV